MMEQFLESERKLQQELDNKQGHIEQLLESERKLQQELNNKQGHIEQLLESERELERIKKSRTWRMSVRLQKISAMLVPPGSARRLVLKMGCRFLCHPGQCVNMLSPRKIRHFFRFLLEEGPGFVSRRMDESMRGISIPEAGLEINDDVEKKSFEDYEVLVFLQTEEPDVTIIIPVYNQFAYTYNCLKSIQENTGDEVRYEIIVADDCSTDDTIRLREKAENIQVIRNTQNLRFLKNCNHAAKSARGRYLVFLNNDTQVQKNWLEPLMQLLEKNSDAGMAGSKFIYADGCLQEAGGIIWKDASAWNYGNRSNPDLPEFNYVRDVDYISGASIMIRTSLWKEIGGFDERFAPAYYEDTDLACEVRKRGYRVMYQPLSAVVHFEGISNGTDIAQGQKAWQDVNGKKFLDKWRDMLEKEHYANGEHVFHARDRSRKKKTLLVVDHYVPSYDRDAGSRCIFYYLQLFTDMGYNVKFIGDNFYKSEPYTTVLQQMGIEVLYGDYYYNNWKDWIRRNGKYFDYVLLSRPHIAVRYIDLIRSCSDAKIIYFGHDLHYLREMREYELNGSRRALKDSMEWKKLELALMRKADISYYLSSVELAEISREDPAIKTRCVPINIYRQIPDIHYSAADRKDLLFVGGFGHPPNIDAVKWLAEEIMPQVWEGSPDIILHVVGSNPPQEIRNLSGACIIIHGFVPDEELEIMYQNVKLAVVPLRYGAGIKGKIIEGMLRGVPIVTTNIGIEGIAGAEKIAKIYNDASGLARCITQLYEDNKQLEWMAVEEHNYIADHYSMQNAVEVLGEDFDFGSQDFE